MKYTGKLFVDKVLANEMERICQESDSSVKKDGIEFDEEYKFDNGIRMAIQVCTTSDPSEESCYTQGVLFDKDGNELACTDVGESFLGEYNIYDGDDEYEVNVVIK